MFKLRINYIVVAGSSKYSALICGCRFRKPTPQATYRLAAEFLAVSLTWREGIRGRGSYPHPSASLGLNQGQGSGQALTSISREWGFSGRQDSSYPGLRTHPGFNMPFGSKTLFMPRISSIFFSSRKISRSGILTLPTPCSAVMIPPSLTVSL